MAVLKTHRRARVVASVSALATAGLLLAACGSSSSGTTAAAGTSAGKGQVGVELILKNFTNPYFISMQKDAEAAAAQNNVKLTVAAGTKDGDTATQITAIENAVSAGDKGILITPNGDAVIPAIKKARAAGLYVIALDTVPTPPTAVDITFATDNFSAGKLIGEWTNVNLAGKPADIAMLDLFNDQVVSVDVNRDHGFLTGLGINPGDPNKNGGEAASGTYTGTSSGSYTIACHQPTQGAQDGGKTAMENCLSKDPNINVVYTINEPAAQGAYQALKAAGKKALVISIDGGCNGVNLVKTGIIQATAQQYPGRMASLGIKAISDFAATGTKPSVTAGLGFFNTGTALVTDAPATGVQSITTTAATQICWGTVG